MNELSLWFAGESSPQLLRSSFLRSGTNERFDACRGKTSGAFTGNGSFQWTPAVQAFCILALRSKAHQTAIPLEGVAGSAASSLDYALGKEPNWLLDILGVEQSGRAYARKLFLRTNPEQKRAGPAAVALNHRNLPIEQIQIFFEERPVFSSETLLELAKQVEERYFRIPTSNAVPHHISEHRPEVSEFPKQQLRQLFSDLIFEECHGALVETDIFNRRALKSRVALVADNPAFRAIAGNNSASINQLADDAQGLDRLGLASNELELERELCADKPIRIALPFTATSAFAIFSYLKYVKGYNIELLYRYPHAVEIAQQILRDEFDEPPDFCTFGAGPAANILGSKYSKEYQPFMLLPRLRQRVVAPRSKKRTPQQLDKSVYHFIKDAPSNPAFHFDELLRTKAMRPGSVEQNHIEPDEAVQLLADGDDEVRAILFFPHFELNRIFNNCELVEDPVHSVAGTHSEIFLFAQQSFLASPKQTRCMKIAIRDAWLDLREDPQKLRDICSFLMGKEDYFKFLCRSSGLHNLKGLSLKEKGTLPFS